MRARWSAGIVALVCANVAGVICTASAFDFLHIAANAGGSSGGHAALRVGDTVYHFVHQQPGILRLERTTWARFEFQYRVLENRAIVVHRIPVTGETEAAIVRGFDTRFVADAQALETGRALAADAGFAAAASAARAGDGAEPGIDLAMVGLFATSAREEEPALAVVRSALVADWMETRQHMRDDVLRRVPQRVLAAEVPAAAVDRVAPPYYGLAERVVDVRMGEAADDILHAARPLDGTALRICAADACRLGDGEVARLGEFGRSLERRIVRLLRSTRPDAGAALVLAMARLAAVDRSLRAGRWMVLDGYGAAAVTVAADDVARRRDALEELRQVAGAELAAARATFGGAEGDDDLLEMRYAAVESAANRLLELDEALRMDHGLRMQAGVLVPSRARSMAAGSLPWSRHDLRDLAVTLAARQRRHAASVVHTRGYGLLTRNCVTEIDATIGQALAQSAAGGGADAVWARQIGGRPPGPWPLSAIPLTAAALLDRAFPGAIREDLPSVREKWLADLYAAGWPLLGYLREANTLTARLYRPRMEDSAFLLFTDDVVPLRPVYGTINLATGVAATVAGAMAAPFDHGRLALAGLRGVLFSLPELAFANIRKGTYDLVPCAPPAAATSSRREGGDPGPAELPREASSRCTASP